MNPSPQPSSEVRPNRSSVAGLYLWQGSGILLMGQVEDCRYVLARGWIENDRLTHVRRWRFATAKQFAGQVRRLVLEASGDYHLAAHERLTALALLSEIHAT